jgi:hypothetical protein
MSESHDQQHRTLRRESARTPTHEAAGPGREHRRRSDTSGSSASPRWRFTNAVQAARELNLGRGT